MLCVKQALLLFLLFIIVFVVIIYIVAVYSGWGEGKDIEIKILFCVVKFGRVKSGRCVAELSLETAVLQWPLRLKNSWRI
jgi:hypothetical protein